MDLTVYGAGAIGGSVGAFLVRAGEQVLFVDKNREHVQTMIARGLKIDGHRGEFVVNTRATTPDALNEKLGVVLLAVKSQDTEEAVREFLPWLREDSMVVSLQNGLNEELIARLIERERTIGAFVNLPADYIGPGHIRLGGMGSLYVGELDGTISARVESLQKTLSAAFPVELSTNILGVLWSKQVYASLLFATALADLSVDEVVRTPQWRSVLGDLVREAMQVPGELGVSLESFDEFDPLCFQDKRDEEALEKIAEHFGGQIKNKTGVWRDLAVRKRRTEVDGIIGVTVRKGEERGLSLPLNRRLMELIHEMEDGKRPMAIENFQALIDQIDSRLR